MVFFFFAEAGGQEDVICFRNMAQFIERKIRKETNNSPGTNNVVKMTARIIKADIRDKEYNTDYYPSNSEYRIHRREKNGFLSP